MTISNNKFDRISARRNRLEKRSERLESRIDTLEERLEDLDPITDYKKIERIQNRIDKFNDRLDLANTRMVETMEILPKVMSFKSLTVVMVCLILMYLTLHTMIPTLVVLH